MSGSATEGPPPPSLHGFCGVCWYFAQALTDSLREVGREVPTLGLACAAAVGSQIENWLPSSEVLRRECRHKMHTDIPAGQFLSGAATTAWTDCVAIGVRRAFAKMNVLELRVPARTSTHLAHPACFFYCLTRPGGRAGLKQPRSLVYAPPMDQDPWDE
jgi:hypothetical protein